MLCLFFCRSNALVFNALASSNLYNCPITNCCVWVHVTWKKPHMISNCVIDNQIHSNCGLFLHAESQQNFMKFHHRFHLKNCSTNIMLFQSASLVRCSSSNNFHHDASWMSWLSGRTVEIAECFDIQEAKLFIIFATSHRSPALEQVLHHMHWHSCSGDCKGN